MAFSFEQEPRSNPEGLIDPFIITERYDICPKCRAQRVELYSFNNIPQNYSDAVNAYLRGYEVNYNKYEIRMMKCKSCNHEFVIDWTMGFPVPLKNSYRTNRFFSEFVRGY